MKLKAVFLLIGLVLGCFSYGQIKIGDQPQNIDPASVLELESTSRALVLTRVNNTQMNAIRPLQGALVYNTETKCVHYYEGTQWLNICDALTNSVNISMVDNGDGSYTFTDAVGVETIITTTTNITFEVANDSLVLTDSNNNALSVALDSLNRHTYSSDAVVNLPTSDSTIVITKTDNNYNFEVGEITGLNILDRSITREDIAGTAINGDFHIQNRSTPVLKLVPGTNGQLLQTQTVTGQPTVVWVNKAGLFSAAEISYDPTVSGLTATTVKLAIDEISTSSNSLTIGDILTQGNDAGAQLIRNLLDPSSAQDAATRNYVDNAISGSDALPNTNIFVGDAVGTAQAVPVSGDATMDNAGILTITPNAITFNEILDRTIGEPDLSFNSVTSDILRVNAVTSDKILDGTIINTDISSTAAIEGTKITPNFGAQNITTTGTLNTGNATVGTLNAGNSTVTGTLTTSGTATVGANTITNVDGANGQVLTTDGAGSATWTSLPADINTTYTAGEALTLSLTDEFSVTDNAITSAKITDGTVTNIDVAPSAAIEGTKIDPNFGSQNITTTGTLASGNTTITGILSTTGTATVGANTITNIDGANGQVLTTDGAGSATWTSLPADINTTYTAGEALTLSLTDEFSVTDNAITSAKITDGTVTNIDVAPSAAIEGTKIDPNFGSQNITTTGTLASGNTTITGILSTTGTATVGANTITNVDGANGQVLTTDGAGSATWTSLPADINTTYTAGEALTLSLTDEFSVTDNAITSAKITDGTVTNIDVAPSAAIEGTKIDPNFGSQNITTTGTLASGNTTITGILSTTGTATVGANTITNIDGANGQVLTTDGAGSATWTSLPADINTTYTAGEALTLSLTDEFSVTDNAITSAKITDGTVTNIDVAPSAAIEGTKIDPNFGSQNITTTGTLASGNTTITGSLEITEEILDANGDAGTVGQVLSSTVTGTDWINPPTIVAMGKVDPAATSERTNSFVTSVVRTSPGNYTVTMSSALNLNYVIQLSLFQAGPDISIEVTLQTSNSFTVQISRLSIDTTGPSPLLTDTPVDADWYFTVTDF